MRLLTLSFIKKILLCCIMPVLSVLIVFLAFEGYVRLSRPDINLYKLTGRVAGSPTQMSEWAFVDAFCAYKAKPSLYAGGKTVNSHSFISTPEITQDKPDDTVRIVFLGGSSTAGTGKNLPNKRTWPWQTVQMIREQVPTSIDFINGAVGGYTSFESYGRLWSRIRHFSPDIIVVNHGWNEMYYFEKSDNILSWRIRKDGSWSIEQTTKPTISIPPHWIDPTIKWSQLLCQIRFHFFSIQEGEVGAVSELPLREDFNHKGLPIWRTNLKLLREACAIMDAKLFVTKQATLIVPKLPIEERTRCRYNFHGFDHDAHVRAFSEIYKIIDEEISVDSVIDLTPLSGRPELFYDHIHPTSLGCYEIASLVSKPLVSYIKQMNIDQP
jgi:hypothetical protein